jgi:hypothetical protein
MWMVQFLRSILLHCLYSLGYPMKMRMDRLIGTSSLLSLLKGEGLQQNCRLEYKIFASGFISGNHFRAYWRWFRVSIASKKSKRDTCKDYFSSSVKCTCVIVLILCEDHEREGHDYICNSVVYIC